MNTSSSLRLALVALAASTSLTSLSAQTAPTGRPSPTPTATPTPAPAGRPTPIRIGAPKPAATATPTPVPTATPAPTGRPAPIRIGTPQPAATPTPAATPAPAPAGRPAPIRIGTPKPATTPTPAPAPAATPAPAPAGRPAPIRVGTPTASPATPPVVIGRSTTVPGSVELASIAKRESEPPRGGVDEIVPSGRAAPPRLTDKVEMETGAYRPRGAVIAPGRFSDQLKKLGETETFTLADLKANPKISLGATKVDMTRVLANPQSVANRALVLQGRSDLAAVNNTSFAVTRVGSGLVVRSFLNYTLKPGTCTDLGRRDNLEKIGMRCATPMTAAARKAAFETPENPRYIADPVRRAELLAEGAEDAKQLMQDVATLRADLKNPAYRAELVAALGATEVARLDKLSDEGLATEIVNSGETKMEDVSYIPINDAVEAFKPAVKQGLTPPPPPGPIKQEFDLGTQYFLAGFTFGREYEWRMRIEQRIKRCLIGCAKTYYVEAFAGFNYGLGLRFPIEVKGKANLTIDGGSGGTTASVTPTFRAFDGNPEQYLAAGLPPEKLFGGKEFVAQFGAHAGFGFDIPFYPALSIAFSKQIDFTDYLEGKFKGGNFDPPAPPSKANPAGERLEAPITLKDVDLLGGQANFGFVGAQVFPSAKIILTSDDLSFTVANKNGKPAMKGVKSGSIIQLNTDTATGALEFDIKDPVYNLVLTVEPGIVARLFVDIGLWGSTWDIPVYFPSLALSVPSTGVTFACHDGTVCSRDYTLAPNSTDVALQGIARWVNQFETKWLGRCRDSECENNIRFIRAGYEGQMKKRITQVTPTSSANLGLDPYFANLFSQADILGLQQKWESDLRRFNIEFEPTWSAKCADTKCRSAIKLVRTGAAIDFKKLIDNPPPKPAPGQGIYLENLPWESRYATAEKEAMTAIISSIDTKLAGSTETWIAPVRAGYDKQCQDLRCRFEVAFTADVMGGEAAKISKLSPDLKKRNVVSEVVKQFKPRFEKAVLESKNRVNPEIH